MISNKILQSGFLMLATRKQKKARNYRGAEMLSDINNLDSMLGGNHLERKEGEFSDSIRRRGSPNFNAAENNEEYSYPNSRENRSYNSAKYGHNSAGTYSCAEFIKLPGELNLRISREMDEVMKSVSTQIQRAGKDAISNQVLPQIRDALGAGSGQKTQKGWNVSAERPESNSEENPSQNIRSSSRSEPFRNRLHDENADSTHDI